MRGEQRHATDTEYSVLFNQRGWQQAAVLARCVCGWSGPRQVFDAWSADRAQERADRDAAAHLRPDGGEGSP